MVAKQEFSAGAARYDDAISWAEEFTVAGERVWAVDGTASYGRGLTAALARGSEWVIEFHRPCEKASKDGAKSDELDAVRVAREALGRDRLHTPRAHDGHREALRVHTATRAGLVRARTAAANDLKALVLTATDDRRQDLRHSTMRALAKRGAEFRDTPLRPVAERCARNTVRSIARRITCSNDEVAVHDTAMKQLIDEAAPQLVAEPGIGHGNAAMFCIAWSHPGRCRSEAALADSAVRHRGERHQANASTVTASPAGATANSTTLSASSRSLEAATTKRPATTDTGDAPRARPTARFGAASSATSRGESGGSSSTHPCLKSPT